LWIDGNGLLRKAVYRLASGKPAKDILYRYRDSGNESLPAELSLVDRLAPAPTATTILEYLSHQKVEHPVSIFDPRNEAPH